MSPLSRGFKNVFRNGIRSLSVIAILSLAVGLSLVMVVANQAVDNKIATIKSSVGNTITITPAGYSNFSSVNNDLNTSQLAKLRSTPHIVALNEALTDRLTTIGSSQPNFGFGGSNTNSNNQTNLTSPVTLNQGRFGRFFSGGGNIPTNFSLPISVLGTTDPSQVNNSTININEGSTINGGADNNQALVSSSMANKNNLKVGSTFQAYGKNLTVSGIFNSSNKATENTIIVSLATLDSLSNQSGAVTQAVATVDSSDNLVSATNSIKQTLGSSADVVNSQQQATATIQPLQNVKTIATVSLIGSVIAGAIIIFLIMLLLVRERRREIGVLKAIGSSSLRVIEQFTSEAATLTLCAALLGIIFGSIAAAPITNTLVSSSKTTTVSSSAFGPGGGGGGFARHGEGAFVRGSGLGSIRANFLNVHAAVGWSIILYGLLVAVVISLIGSSLASYLITKVRPAEVLRTE